MDITCIQVYLTSDMKLQSQNSVLVIVPGHVFFGLCYRLGYQRLMTELLSPMVVMLEGLGFNLCVAPFLNICVLNLPQGLRMEYVRGGWS